MMMDLPDSLSKLKSLMTVLSENVMNNYAFALLVWGYFRCCVVKIPLRRRICVRQKVNYLFLWLYLYMFKKSNWNFSIFVFSFHDIINHTCQYGACAKNLNISINYQSLEHDDIMAWKRFSHYCLCKGNPSVTYRFILQRTGNAEFWCFLC